jgi:hypothetical protein
MKTFKKFFEASAADYVAPKDDDDEAKDIKPRSKGEKKFKDDHKIEKKKHPTASDVAHTGDIKKEEVEVKEDSDFEINHIGNNKGKIVKSFTSKKKALDYLAKNQKKFDTKKLHWMVNPDLWASKIVDGGSDLKEDEIYEDVFSDLENIVKTKSIKKVKFANGKTLKVDLFTASAFVNMFKKVSKQNAERGKAHIEKSPENFMRMMDLAFGGGKK